jgi:chromosome segregation protein
MRRLKVLEINGFKSFAEKTTLEFDNDIVCIVGPNGSGKSNVVESLRYVLGEQSMKSMRGKTGGDLIFKGSKNLSKGSRAGVSVYFNNSDKIFKLAGDGGEDTNLNFDTIEISRVVYSDGLNKYLLNGSEVRLKDIHNLLASVNIGSSGHHIISQGEADRILNANAKERREMVEDALGLKIYQIRIKESERKLARTEENMKEVTLQRRENAPHLNFLKRQVEKFEKGKEMQAELVVLYREYLKKESIYLDAEKEKLSAEKSQVTRELEGISSKLGEVEDDSPKETGKIEELKQTEQKLNEVRALKGEIERKLGRVEGMIEAEERRAKREDQVLVFPPEEVKDFVSEINKEINEAVLKASIEEVRPILEKIKAILASFDKNKNQASDEKNILEINNLKNTQKEILHELDKLREKEGEIAKEVLVQKEAINQEMEALRDLEKEKFKFKVRHQELSSALELIRIKEETLRRRVGAFEDELKEGAVLIGEQILSYKDFVLEGSTPESEGDTAQEELRKKIERIKIKLEDIGMGSGVELMKEFEEVTQRDEFLAKELEDLSKSIESLQNLIVELKEKIDIEFREGVKKINVEFQEFFSLLFDGGHGSLAIIAENKKKKLKDAEEGQADEVEGEELEEDTIPEQGIEINVSLPHKKVKELHALSGGERSLTSIAILFAMSAVNPPPFLVLDETDAALDEANSRKYGDMLEKLSKHSQLVVVTHNRETMARAGVLYGVTIGSNGASKLLSIKFEEATQIAK